MFEQDQIYYMRNTLIGYKLKLQFAHKNISAFADTETPGDYHNTWGTNMYYYSLCVQSLF